MGPAASVNFYRRLVASTSAARDQDHLPVLIDACPDVPDRTAFILGQGPDPTPALIRKARLLEAAGAQLLVMACNTAYAFGPQVAASVGVPLVDVPMETAAYVRAQMPALRRVGLLATTGTVRSGLYQRAFRRQGIDTVVPTAADQQELVMEAIYGERGVKSGADFQSPRQIVQLAGQHLIDSSAQALLLACTELSALFADTAPAWSAPLFDAAQVAAERVIVLAGGEVKDPRRT
jgi:aspartate racemase